MACLRCSNCLRDADSITGGDVNTDGHSNTDTNTDRDGDRRASLCRSHGGHEGERYLLFMLGDDMDWVCTDAERKLIPAPDMVL